MKTLICFCLILALSSNSVGQAKPTAQDTLKGKGERQETIKIVQEVDPKVIQEYQNILEKTNNQLSLSWTPLSTFISALGVLFALSAIVVGYFIWRQSKDYKDMLKASLDTHTIRLNTSIENHQIAFNKLLEEKNVQIETQINVLTEIINKNSTDQNIVDVLKQERDSLVNQIQTSQHIGWDYQDIKRTYPVSNMTTFNALIVLQKPYQRFVVYIRVVTPDNRRFWLGFGGDLNADVYHVVNEHTETNTYNSTQVTLDIPVRNQFKKAFPDVHLEPTIIDTIRIRGSEQSFNFKYHINNG